MMKKLISILLFLILFINVSATHNRAGEITYRQLSDLTFEITITTFTYTLSLADRPTLDVEWGDNSISTAPRIEIDGLPNFYQKNVYKATHTFPGPGLYRIVVQDPNRNFGVLNIPNSVNVVFSIQSILTVNPAYGLNNTPVLLNPPYDKAAKDHIFIHNPGAFDHDGDSLSYELTVCTREDGRPIENYTFPPATNKFYVDSVSGDLVWDAPPVIGTYNVAIEIQEWRNGVKIGMVERDMQIEVFETTNHDPVNGPLKDLCVEVGDTVNFLVTSTDSDMDHISLKATSGAFGLTGCSAQFTKIDSVPGMAVSRFFWVPCFESVRNQPYNIIIKSEDDNSELNLFDIDHMNIKVLGPSPNLNSILPEGKFIRLGWESYGSDQIAGFNIYRRETPTTFTIDSCSSGIPLTSGYKRIGFIAGATTTDFTDTEGGLGLQFGVEYGYRIVAVYNNGTESKASNEISSSLVSGLPLITNVSVRTTSVTNGSIYLSWKRPDNLDTIPGPYEYQIHRSDGITGTGFQLIKTIQTIDLNDTVYIDTLINTQSKGYLYKIELYNISGARYQVGDPGIASSMFMEIAPGDRKAKITIRRNVPWINSRYDIFRLNLNTMEYDSIGTSTQLEIFDSGLTNGTEYCYYIRSTGSYSRADYPKNLVNFSQKGCITPIDNERPCAPDLRVSSQCDSLYNKLTWTVADPVCFADVVGYKIYYKQTREESLNFLINIENKNIFSFIHDSGESMAGCYAITALDGAGNESDKSVMICIDSCNFYEIPNVFTPNGDAINDNLVAKTSGLVENVDFKIFNRNGLMLFQTSEPRLNWDGTYKGNIVSPGVYFYQCDVFERRITGLEQYHLSGFVHVITEKDAKVNKPEF